MPSPWRTFAINEQGKALQAATHRCGCGRPDNHRGRCSFRRKAIGVRGGCAKTGYPNHALLPGELTAFERFIQERDIPELMWEHSIELRAWARENATRRYVPERLLRAFGLERRVEGYFTKMERLA